MSTEPELTEWQARLTEHFLAGGTVEMRHSLRGGAYWYLKPAPEQEATQQPPTCLTCGAEVKPCSGTHWHHVEKPAEPHFPRVKETPA